MNKNLWNIKEFIKKHKDINCIKVAVFLLLSGILVLTAISLRYSKDVTNGISDSLIRLHVVANSDSDDDQQLKRDVRDTIIAFMKGELETSKTLEQTKMIIAENLQEIEKLAQNKVKSYGKEYKVEAMVGNYPFPTKTYGDIALPAGHYQALRVVIGKGEGANWWCVLFPPLCFVDATHGTISDSVKDDLKEVLTTEEYNIITSADDDKDIPVKLRFKIVEFFQDSKIKFTGMLNKIFKTGE